MAANARSFHGHRSGSAGPSLHPSHGRYSLETIPREVLGIGLGEIDQGHLERRIPASQDANTVLSLTACLRQSSIPVLFSAGMATISSDSIKIGVVRVVVGTMRRDR